MDIFSQQNKKKRRKKRHLVITLSDLCLMNLHRYSLQILFSRWGESAVCLVDVWRGWIHIRGHITLLHLTSQQQAYRLLTFTSIFICKQQINFLDYRFPSSPPLFLMQTHVLKAINNHKKWRQRSSAANEIFRSRKKELFWNSSVLWFQFFNFFPLCYLKKKNTWHDVKKKKEKCKKTRKKKSLLVL